ncbi:MAG TPA: hypothetical protein VF491_27070 [Vicinamibacterales bacterium]|jgi:hypothetical protein
MRRFLLTAALAIGIATPSAAQGVKLTFHDGLVTVDANSVPVRTILTEWGKVGGTKVVGAERIPGAPLTIKLVDVSEAKALESILRSVAGYMVAPRKTGAGASMYDRILVMATSSAPPAVATAARPTAQIPNNSIAANQRFAPPRQRPEQAEEDDKEEPDENPPNPPVFTFPQPGQNGVMTNVSPTGQTVTYTINPQTGQPQGVTTIQPGQPVQPNTPIGVARPGMMVPAPAPQQVQPATPGQMIRPPGGN